MTGIQLLQDGKLIGAVTFLMEEDPRQGYGIFIGNKLEQMSELLR